MRKLRQLGLIILLFFCFQAKIVLASDTTIYALYIEWGRTAITEADYKSAVSLFEYAQSLNPQEQTPQFYINLIKRIKDGDIKALSLEQRTVYDDLVVPSKQKVPAKVVPTVKRIPAFKKIKPKVKTENSEPKPVLEKKQVYVPKDIKDKINEPLRRAPVKVARKEVVPQVKSDVLVEEATVYLDDDLNRTQPNTILRIPLNSYFILEGRHIERFLVITPGYINIERTDQDHLVVTAEKRGTTLLHVWDDTGRWTFKVEVTLPQLVLPTQVEERKSVTGARPFSFTYLNDWSQFYRGTSFNNVGLLNVNFVQTMEVFGETPYGDLGGFVIANKFDEATVVTGYGISLSDGKIWNFKDFKLSGFDTQKTFSPLTISGQYFRGVMIEAMAFDRKLAYTYLQGKDRQTFGFIAPGIIDEKESYVEGFKLTLFPDEDNQYSFNYGRGFGSAREDFLQDNVYSLQAQRRIKGVLVSHETAFDTDNMANLSSAQWVGKNADLTVNFRDINKRYSALSNQPSNRGEIGGTILFNYKMDKANIFSTIDLFRDRLFFDEENSEKVNMNFLTVVDMPITNTDRFNVSLNYANNPQELSPRENFRLSGNYSKRLKIFNLRDLSAFIKGTYQRNRFELSPTSEYDRYSLLSGFNFDIIKNLNYYWNYEYSWVDEKSTGDLLRPNVTNTGINFSKQLTKGWRGDLNLGYRNEEDTEGNNSFLAGEDSLTGSIGLTFRPNEDLEYFMDGRFRNSWAESSQNDAFNDIDVRLGIRTTWDSPFVWNPKGYIAGTIFKDLNGNGVKEANELGISDVGVIIGDEEVFSDYDGDYYYEIKAKRADVRVDVDTAPRGYIFTTPTVKTVDILHRKISKANFGLSTQSGIYGIVYVDVNGNGKPDERDEFVSNVGITLDGKLQTFSGSDGAYFFRSIEPGEHAITINMKTISFDYLPQVKLKNSVKVQEGTTYLFHIPLKKTK